jgi:hypothetical protein
MRQKACQVCNYDVSHLYSLVSHGLRALSVLPARMLE